jgi:hypothetical protein
MKFNKFKVQALKCLHKYYIYSKLVFQIIIYPKKTWARVSCF